MLLINIGDRILIFYTCPINSQTNYSNFQTYIFFLSDRESREDTPPSPRIFSRNVSNSTATPDSLSPGTRSPERQASAASLHCSTGTTAVPLRLASQGSLEGSAGSSQGSQDHDHQLITSPRNAEYEGLNFKR